MGEEEFPRSEVSTHEAEIKGDRERSLGNWRGTRLESLLSAWAPMSLLGSLACIHTSGDPSGPEGPKHKPHPFQGPFMVIFFPVIMVVLLCWCFIFIFPYLFF